MRSGQRKGGLPRLTTFMHSFTPTGPKVVSPMAIITICITTDLLGEPRFLLLRQSTLDGRHFILVWHGSIGGHPNHLSGAVRHSHATGVQPNMGSS